MYTKFDLIYNQVTLSDGNKKIIPNKIVRIIETRQAEQLIKMSLSKNFVVAIASPFACPIVPGDIAKFVESRGYYLLS